jgi:hypothetical protein
MTHKTLHLPVLTAMVAVLIGCAGEPYDFEKSLSAYVGLPIWELNNTFARQPSTQKLLEHQISEYADVTRNCNTGDGGLESLFLGHLTEENVQNAIGLSNLRGVEVFSWNLSDCHNYKVARRVNPRRKHPVEKCNTDLYGNKTGYCKTVWVEEPAIYEYDEKSKFVECKIEAMAKGGVVIQVQAQNEKDCDLVLKGKLLDRENFIAKKQTERSTK